MSTSFSAVSTYSSAARVMNATRVAGFAGLFFAVLVALVNIAVGAAAPPAFDASANDIVSYFTENNTLLSFATAAVPFGVVSLYLFISGSFPRLAGTSEAGSFWARFGAIGVVIVEVMFLVRMMFEFVTTANIERLAEEPVLVETLWQIQTATMFANGLAIGVALLGLSRAARIGGLIPRWQEWMGIGAAVAFFGAMVGAVPSLGGASIGLLGLPAFLVWLVWLALTSIRLIRTSDASA